VNVSACVYPRFIVDVLTVHIAESPSVFKEKTR